MVQTSVLNNQFVYNIYKFIPTITLIIYFHFAILFKLFLISSNMVMSEGTICTPTHSFIHI